MSIQPQEVVAEFAKVLESDTPRSAKLAFVTRRSLARLQARRLTSRPQVEFFTDHAAAEDWLFA